MGVRSSGSGLKSECADNFSSEPDLWLLRHTDEAQRGRNSCLWLQSRSVLSSFGVVLMSCRVISRSTISIAVFCLQNLICLRKKTVLSGISAGLNLHFYANIVLTQSNSPSINTVVMHVPRVTITETSSRHDESGNSLGGKKSDKEVGWRSALPPNIWYLGTGYDYGQSSLSNKKVI